LSRRFEKIFDSWRVTVSDTRREIRTFTFGDSFKVEAMAERGNAFKTSPPAKASSTACPAH